MRNLLTFSALLVVSLLTLTGCDFIGGEEEIVDPGPPVLFPLEVGNTWQYQTDDGSTLRLTAIEKVRRDGEVWTVVKDSESGPQGTVGAYRNTGEGLYNAEYHRRNDELDPVSLFFRFPVEDTVYTFSNVEISVESDTVEVPAGTFAAYTYVTKSDAEGTIRWSFAPNVGLVRVQNEVGTFELTSYDLE